jgi:hypothetical protein
MDDGHERVQVQRAHCDIEGLIRVQVRPGDRREL